MNVMNTNGWHIWRKKTATMNVRINVNLLIWWTVTDHEKLSIRIPDANAETLHPYTLDCPSAKSSIRTFNLLFLMSVSSKWQATYVFDVEHSIFLRLATARMLLEVASNRTMAIKSESWGKVSPEHWSSRSSPKPWNDFEDNPGKIRNCSTHPEKRELTQKNHHETTLRPCTLQWQVKIKVTSFGLYRAEKLETKGWIPSEFTPVIQLIFPKRH